MAFLGLVTKATLQAAVAAERSVIDQLHEDRGELQTQLETALREVADTQLELSQRTTELTEVRAQLAESTRRNIRLAGEYSKLEQELTRVQGEALAAQQRAAEKYSDLEARYMTAVAHACDAQAECERWAHAVRNGAGAADLEIPARPRRKTTRKTTTKDPSSAPKKTTRRRKNTSE